MVVTGQAGKKNVLPLVHGQDERAGSSQMGMKNMILVVEKSSNIASPCPAKEKKEEEKGKGKD